MNVFILIIIFVILCKCCYSCYKKEGFGVKKKVKKLAKLIPVNRKILVPIEKQTKHLVGSVTKQPRSILKKFNDPPAPPKNKKSVWWHPAVVTGAIAGTGMGVGGGEIYNRAKDGRFTRYYEIVNPITGEKGYYRFGRSQFIPEDDRIFVKYDGPPECRREGGETKCHFKVNKEDYE